MHRRPSPIPSAKSPPICARPKKPGRVSYVVDTHLHADHISAGRELAKAAGAEYVLHGDADVTFPFRGVRDGEVLELGNVTIEVLHTPGHTPEHISLLITDRTRSREPWFVFTGHTLMVGDLGRTELATSAADGARALFASVQKLKALPDHLEVLPGAYSGSVCGRSLSGKPSSTIGFERRYNKAFAIDDATDFVGFIVVKFRRPTRKPPQSAPQMPAASPLRPDADVAHRHHLSARHRH